MIPFQEQHSWPVHDERRAVSSVRLVLNLMSAVRSLSMHFVVDELILLLLETVSVCVQRRLKKMNRVAEIVMVVIVCRMQVL